MSVTLNLPTAVAARTISFSCCILICIFSIGLCSGKVQYKVRCSNDVMKVELVKSQDVQKIYLDQLKNYPDEKCHPQIENNKATFLLSLVDIHRCGVTRIHNRITGRRVYYHRIIVEHNKDSSMEKEVIVAKCITGKEQTNHTLVKRNVLPAGFQEPEDLEITTSLTIKAPEPMLNVGVRQGKERISGELNVNPGTPLTMEIYLDQSSAPVYGVLVSFMQVTDTKQQEETIIFNGCSLDPYLFENFNTVDGDFLSAKFRAFKFPDSTYVQFKGTVNVCLDKCRGIQCSNGQTGYGRKRRSVAAMPPDPNKLFEVSLTTFIKINFLNNTTEELKTGELIRAKNSTKNFLILEDDRKEEQLVMRSPTKGNGFEDENKRLKHATETFNEEFKYSVIEESSNDSNTITWNFSLIVLLAAAALATARC